MTIWAAAAPTSTQGTTQSGASTSAASGTSTGTGLQSMGKDAFLKLLVAQMKNQDPMKPSNPEQLAAQLAQFSSLEQLMNINSTLASQGTASTALSTAMNNSAAVGLIGKSVLASGNAVTVDGSGNESVTVGVGSTGGDATLTLTDANGNVVGSRDLGFLGGGRQDIALGDLTKGLDPGQYSYSLKCTDSSGQAVKVQTFERAMIDGLQYGTNGPVLLSGNLQIPLANVAEITTPTT